MSSHSYNTRQQSLTTIEEQHPPETNANDTEVSETVNTEVSETANLIMKLEKNMNSRFDSLDKEILTLKDNVIKNLQMENERLRKKVDDLENKIETIERDHNSLEQYGRRNNIEIAGIPDSVLDGDLEKEVTEIMKKINVDISENDIEACHRMGYSKNNSKKTIVRFINRKYAKKALINRKNLRSITSHKNIFINENLTTKNNKIAYLSRKLKRSGHLEKAYTKDGTVHISSPDINRGKVIKIYHINELFSLFPDYDFGENHNEDEQNESMQSSY